METRQQRTPEEIAAIKEEWATARAEYERQIEAATAATDFAQAFMNEYGLEPHQAASILEDAARGLTHTRCI
ncbi:MAG: hypothetical protein WBP22_03125 [Candidatus Saccharimonas sp.]